MQVSCFQDPGIQPFIDHSPDYSIRDSLVEDFAKVGVWNAVEGSYHTLPTSVTRAQ
jgi:hypothetical protein